MEPSDDASHANTLSRYVTVKEEHAELCKHELEGAVGGLHLAQHRRQ